MFKKPLITFNTPDGILYCDIEAKSIAPEHTLVIRYEKETGLSIKSIPTSSFKKTLKTSPR